MTSISENGVGKVLGGKPIKASELGELGITERTYSRYIKLLRDAGYINTTKTMYGLIITINKASKIFNNRATPKVAYPATPKSVKQHAKSGVILTKNGGANKTIQLDNTKTIQVTNVTAKADKRKPEIDELFNYWTEATGLPITARLQANRYACSNLLKKHGEELLKRLIGGVAKSQGDQYAPRIADFTQLQSKMNELMLWGKKQSIKKGVLRV